MAAARYVAFLRAVNVGGRIIKMAELKRIFERAGFSDVSTFIASGNVIFRSWEKPLTLELQIERALKGVLGFPVTTMLRTAQEVARVAATDRFLAHLAAGASLYVGFTQYPAAPEATAAVAALSTANDQMHVDGREVYWLVRKKDLGAVSYMGKVERALRIPVTFRNMNTVRRLAAKYPD